MDSGWETNSMKGRIKNMEWLVSGRACKQNFIVQVECDQAKMS